MQSCELVYIVSVLACHIAQGRSAEELDLLASLFSQLGDTLDTISAEKALCEAKNNTSGGSCKQ